jgi:fumarate hydratase class I
MNIESWQPIIYDLIGRTSTDIPPDVEQALQRAVREEAGGSNAAAALSTMLDNIGQARSRRQPLCQDTGSLLFFISAPSSVCRGMLRAAIEAAVVAATTDGILRQNAVDPVSGANSGNNLGTGSPNLHFTDCDEDKVTISLILKGGGCENVGAQYSLPDTRLGAGRDLDGVRRCLLDAVCEAQGRGCAPGVLGVCIGGDRASGYAESKRQLLRYIGERSSLPELAALETRVCDEANQLGIGPMGYGGRTTLLDVFIGCLHRVPASYFVSVSYMCWAYRRRTLVAGLDAQIVAWK